MVRNWGQLRMRQHMLAAGTAGIAYVEVGVRALSLVSDGSDCRTSRLQMRYSGRHNAISRNLFPRMNIDFLNLAAAVFASARSGLGVGALFFVIEGNQGADDRPQVAVLAVAHILFFGHGHQPGIDLPLAQNVDFVAPA